MVNAYARAGDADGAVTWLEAARSAGLAPTAGTYTPVLQAFAQRGDAGIVAHYLQAAVDGASDSPATDRAEALEGLPRHTQGWQSPSLRGSSVRSVVQTFSVAARRCIIAS